MTNAPDPDQIAAAEKVPELPPEVIAEAGRRSAKPLDGERDARVALREVAGEYGIDLDANDGLTRGERMVEQMRGTATRRTTAEEIYEHTRSDL